MQSSLIAQHRQTWKIREYHLLSDTVHGEEMRTIDARMTVDGEFRNFVGLPSGDPLRAHVPEEVRQAQLAAVSIGSSGQRITPYETAASLRSLFQEDADGVRITMDLPLLSPTLTDSRLRKHVFNYVPASACPSRSLSFLPSSNLKGNREGGSMSDSLQSGRDGSGGLYEEYATRVSDILLTGEGHSSWGEFRLIGRVRRFDGLVSICKEYVRVRLQSFPWS